MPNAFASSPAPMTLARVVARIDRRIFVAFFTLQRGWQRWLQRRRDAETCAGLDASTLRDLGVSRSEVESFRAEADGLAERTRLRVATRGLRRPLPAT